MKKIVFLILLLPLLLPPTASAQSLSLSVAPQVLQIEAKPPASVKSPITISNDGDEIVQLRILLKPFTAASSEDGKVRFLPESAGIPGPDPLLFQKVQIRENNRAIQTVTLAPKQQKTLELHIGVTKDSPLADYYFSVIFLSDTPETREGNLSQAAGGIATNVLLSLGPKGKPQGLIEEFSAPLFVNNGPLPFTVRVKNTGERVIAPQGQIMVKNMFGQTVGKVELLPVYILSGTIRAIPDTLQDPTATPSAELQNSLQSTDYRQQPKAVWPEQFLLGLYTADLTLAISEEGPLYTRTVRFFAFPVQGIVGIIIALCIVLFIWYRVKKRIA